MPAHELEIGLSSMLPSLAIPKSKSLVLHRASKGILLGYLFFFSLGLGVLAVINVGKNEPSGMDSELNSHSPY
jgi:hypothetical protein